jgi:hypothetical protein
MSSVAATLQVQGMVELFHAMEALQMVAEYHRAVAADIADQAVRVHLAVTRVVHPQYAVPVAAHEA